MNKYAVLHQSNSRFSYPITDTKAQLRLRTQRDDTIKQINVLWNTFHKYYVKRLTAVMEVRYRDELYDYYMCEIDNGCPGYCYIFEIIETD